MALTSIVDYLKKNGQDSSYAARSQLAASYGIQGYKGTAAQNTQLLKTLQSGAQPATNPAQAQTPTVQTVQPATPAAASTQTKVYQQSFKPTELTNHYKQTMLDTDEDEPGPYNSMYQDTINSILETINNRQPFDVNNDANYQKLYNQQKERYQAAADRSMRDTMAAANVATGGYGSTYGQAVAQQAYDRTMEGLNDQNVNLLNLARQIYNDETANNYNKLAAYQGQDNTMYGRYRDDVADWQNNRAYNASQYWNSFQNDRSAYDTDRSFAYGMDKDEMDRDDALYKDALNTAMSMAQNGLPVPSYVTDRIDQYNKKYGLSGDAAASLAGLAAQVQALQAAKKSSGGGGGRRKGSKKSGSSSGNSWDDIQPNETIQDNGKYIKSTDYMDTLRTIKLNNGGSPLSTYPSTEEYNQYLKDNGVKVVPSAWENWHSQIATDLSNKERSKGNTTVQAAADELYRKLKKAAK
jgi:hypothetical protein